MNEAAFGARFQGAGPRWAAIQRLFEVQCQRLGLNRARVGDAADEAEERSTFRRPSRQGTLFDLRGWRSMPGGEDHNTVIMVPDRRIVRSRR
ncbi:hypothetical protein [Sorangium atrum]|uniref:Uncharacterized protein n=1 Tax=Sorangium atrum TaxID=2995308 RepID=A0ABT5BUK4_9BACT|nr:hypothetical protein [Sorangium aterium]MDC0677403.1 hypothetical protein [Sorangium aterium]